MLWTVGLEHGTEPSSLQFPNTSFNRILTWSPWFRYVSPNIIFLHDALKVRLSPNLFRGSIIDKPFHRTVLADKCLKSLVTVGLPLYWVRFNKYFFVAEHLYILLCMSWIAECIHGVCWHHAMYSPYVKHAICSVSPRKWHDCQPYQFIGCSFEGECGLCQT